MTMTIEDEPETGYVPSVTAIAADCEANRISIDAQNRRIDALQARMDARFAHVDDRFDRLEGRFDQLEERVNHMDARLEHQGNILAKIYAWVEEQPKAPAKKRSAKR